MVLSWYPVSSELQTCVSYVETYSDDKRNRFPVTLLRQGAYDPMNEIFAQVMELVDMKVSKTFAEKRAGSSPALGTISYKKTICHNSQ